MITTAFSSNLMYEPSFLPVSFLCLTTTALWIDFFFTIPLGAASFTETVIMSPIRAYRLFDPPSTLMHCTIFAPVLSATFSLDSACIILFR